MPVPARGIADSTHQVTHWGLVGAVIHTDNGLQGYGYTGTHAHLPTDRLIADCISYTYAPLLIGEYAHDIQRLWGKLCYFPPAQWVGRAGITRLALSAIDIRPLGPESQGGRLTALAASGRRRLQAAGSLQHGRRLAELVAEQLISDAKNSLDQGYRGIKIKIGNADPNVDLDRIAAVRKAIGPTVKFMVDANGKWDLPTAIHFGRRFKDYDIFWFEEPLWYDDLYGHTSLTLAIETPIALGSSSIRWMISEISFRPARFISFKPMRCAWRESPSGGRSQT